VKRGGWDRLHQGVHESKRGNISSRPHQQGTNRQLGPGIQKSFGQHVNQSRKAPPRSEKGGLHLGKNYSKGRSLHTSRGGGFSHFGKRPKKAREVQPQEPPSSVKRVKKKQEKKKLGVHPGKRGSSPNELKNGFFSRGESAV